MKKCLIALLIVSGVVILFLGNAYARSAKDVLKAFKRVESVITVNPSDGKEFLTAFVDAKTEASLGKGAT